MFNKGSLADLFVLRYILTDVWRQILQRKMEVPQNSATLNFIIWLYIPSKGVIP